MNAKNLNVIRTILPVMVFVLLAMTAFLYFTNHQFNISTVVVAMACLLVYLVTKKNAPQV
ncbi:MAG: DUF3852 family protein [Pyrinomonadaceae bacterium]